MIILGAGMGLAFVPVTIAGTSGVAPDDAGLASGLFNMTQQVGGALGLAILSSVATSRTTSALHAGLALPAALTHGFKSAFVVGAVLCAMGAVFTIVLLPGRQREPADEDVQTVALSFTRCPGAPYCGHLARVAAFGRRVRTGLARS
jgi:MFS family permease